VNIELVVSRYKRMIGLARYASELQKYLSKAGVSYSLVSPGLTPLLKAGHSVLSRFGYDVREFFNTYPASIPCSEDSVKHFTSQMMASSYLFQPGLRKVVITVHDIVPYLMRDDPLQNVYRHFYDRWFDSRAMQNIQRADRIIAISACTAGLLKENLSCREDKIRVVLYGLDHELFRPKPVTPEFRARYGLDPRFRYLLYVGSENPRKNLPRLIKAFSKVRCQAPDVRLVKVGTPEYLTHYEFLKSQINSAGLDDDVVFISHPPQEDLITLYSAADVFVFPSLYEGFGMPPLEAMACGAAVICSNASSLPEVVGDAALKVDPYDVDAWAEAIISVLGNDRLRQELKTRGLAQAAQFTWESTVEKTLAVYREVEAL